MDSGATLAEEERFELSTGFRPYAASNGVPVTAGSRYVEPVLCQLSYQGLVAGAGIEPTYLGL